MKEYRFLRTEVRAEQVDGKPMLSGHAAVYNSRSKPIVMGRGGKFIETIKPNAFARCLKRSNLSTVATVEHDPSKPLAKVGQGLELRDDGVGLAVRCPIDMGVSYARDLFANVVSGLVRSMSFGFTVGDDGQTWDDGEDEETGERVAVRTLTDIDDLIDVAFVLNPAYPDAEAGVDEGDRCSKMMRACFPEGVPSIVETRSGNSRIIVPDAPTTEEILHDLRPFKFF